MNSGAISEELCSREDIKYMKAALKQAEKALEIGGLPIGAVIGWGGKINGRG